MNKFFNPEDKLSQLRKEQVELVEKNYKILNEKIQTEIKEQNYIRSDLCKRCGDNGTFLFKEKNFTTCERCKLIIECFIDRSYGDKSFYY